MANIIKPKRSEVPGAVPAAGDLDYGEIALNAADGILYVKRSNDAIVEVGKPTATSHLMPKTGGTFTGSITTSGISANGTTNINGNAVIGTSSNNNLTVQSNTTVNGRLNAGNVNFTGSLREHYTNLGNHHGTTTVNPANGTIQRCTLTGDVSFSGFTNATAGDVVTLILKQDPTGNRDWSNFGNITCRYAGGVKSLSNNPNAVDMVTILYTGSEYMISISAGFTT